jgi:hypothetical protein
MSTTLSELLNGVLLGHQTQFRTRGEEAVREVDMALKHVPIPLSSKQQDAIRNAWTSDLSYIQGPPGTGKSHTITALMLSAAVLEKSVLLVSHKKAAIDVVRNKLRSTLGEEFSIYVGNDVQGRAETRRRIQELRQQIGPGNAQRVSRLIATEKDAAANLGSILDQVERERSLLALSLERAKASYQAQKEHLEYRKGYHAAYGDMDLAEEMLALLPPEISPEWQQIVSSIDEVWSRRVRSKAIAGKDLLRTRIGLVAYRRKFGADWITERPWEIHRLKDHHRALSAYDRARREEKLIQIDLNGVRRRIEELEEQANAQAREYLKARTRRVQLQNAQAAADDLAHFEALFRLRRPSLVRQRMEQIDYAAIAKVFPLWLGEMRHIGSVLALKPGVFDLAVVDEASQVNIAEIVPVFYRAKSFVVVGDQKQLGIEAAGLFGLNRTYEQLVWNSCFSGLDGVFSYNAAKERDLTVCSASILDFIMSPSVGLNIPKVTLDEHFRSMPTLADFTSNAFYQDDGKLKVMTDVSLNLGKECFELIVVGGARPMDGSKFVQEEVEQALTLVHEIISGRALAEGSALWKLGFAPGEPPTIGIISFLTDQRDLLRRTAESEIEEEDRNRLDLFIGTPEEFQGNERDVMILTFGLGEGSPYNHSHYEKRTRFNVATSRARKYTYAVIGQCPAGARLLREYFQHFGFSPAIHSQQDTIVTGNDERKGSALLWSFDEKWCESEFELHLLSHLREYKALQHQHDLALYNQVRTCGQKRLDFVLYDKETTCSVAIEVDGPDHFEDDGHTYSYKHMDRVRILRSAGWKIVHVPFYQWYRNGWLCGNQDPGFKRTLTKFHASLSEALGLPNIHQAT